MAKRKMSILAQAIVLCNSLSPEEQRVVMDLLKHEQPGKPSKTPVATAPPGRQKRIEISPRRRQPDSTKIAEADASGAKRVAEATQVDLETATTILAECNGEEQTAIDLIEARAKAAMQ